MQDRRLWKSHWLLAVLGLGATAAMGRPLDANGKNEWNVGGTTGAVYAGGEVTGLVGSTGYMRWMKPQWLFGGEVAIASVSYDGHSGNAFSLFGVAHYLLDPSAMRQSFFALGAIGVGTASTRVMGGGRSKSEVGFRAGAGKRLLLMPGLFLRPEVYVEKIGDIDPMLILDIVKLTYIW